MGLFVEEALLPDTEGALTEDDDGAFAFPFAMEYAQGQC